MDQGAFLSHTVVEQKEVEPLTRPERRASTLRSPRFCRTQRSRRSCRTAPLPSFVSPSRTTTGSTCRSTPLSASRGASRELTLCVALLPRLPLEAHRLTATRDARRRSTRWSCATSISTSSPRTSATVRRRRFLPLSPRPPSLTFPSASRAVTTLHARHPLTGAALPVAYVQVGALLVASIRRTAREGNQKKRGDALGYFGALPRSPTHPRPRERARADAWTGTSAQRTAAARSCACSRGGASSGTKTSCAIRRAGTSTACRLRRWSRCVRL